MGFEITRESYAGSIKDITIGKGDKAVTVGGKTCYPFYQFEGAMSHKPRIAMEIWDMEPEDWPETALEPFKDVVGDTAAWAKKCVDEYGAEILVLQLKSTDPNDRDASPEDAAASVKKVLAAVDVPLVVWGTTSVQKDEDVLKKISEECEGHKLVLGPVEEKNHKGIAASAMGFGHTVISSSPIDVNLAKQINILLENLGMPMDRMIIDPTTGGLGYGLEYSYSVMERLVMAAITQGDDKLQLPMISNIGNEVWKCKEARETAEEAPELGDPERRGILMEAVCAVSYLIGGGDILILRHPEAVKIVKSFIDLAMNGGSASDVAPISKLMADVDIDFAALASQPDLTIPEEKKAAPAAKAAAPKKSAPPAAAAMKAEPAKAAAPEKPAPAAAKAEESTPEISEAELKAKAEAALKAKAEAEEKARAAAEEKAKTEAAAKAKADAVAKAKAESDAADRREAEEQGIREKRAAEREKAETERAAAPSGAGRVSMTPAKTQKDMLDNILDNLDRIHKR